MQRKVHLDHALVAGEHTDVRDWPWKKVAYVTSIAIPQQHIDFSSYFLRLDVLSTPEEEEYKGQLNFRKILAHVLQKLGKRRPKCKIPYFFPTDVY